MNQQTWSSIVDKALWRVPPFEPSDDGKHEKGFRDALIMASVMEFAKGNPELACAFISDDNLLREAIVAEKLPLLHVFESVKTILRTYFPTAVAFR